MEPGTYRLLSLGQSVCGRERGEASALIELEDGGTVFVEIDGETVFAFPHLEGFLAAQSLTLTELRAEAVRQ
jgi:hypothetical protein